MILDRIKTTYIKKAYSFIGNTSVHFGTGIIKKCKVFPMDEGYILSNKFRRTIFDALSSGETNIDYIAKKYRIIPTVAKKVVDDFINGGILEKKQNRYILTKEGEKLAETIKG